MKRFIAFFVGFCLVALLLPVLAFGNPFLVSDPQSVVDSYGVILDGQSEVLVSAEVLGLGVGRLCYDLQGIEPGSHEIEVKACNVRGCSVYVFFAFTWDPENPPPPENPPGSPTDLRVLLE